jgi:hypothetical protein
MISAKLIKDLEKYGFELEFPGYDSNEKKIIEILKEKNERLNLAIPLLLKDGFDYNKIIKKLDNKLIKEFNKMIIISNKIFRLEKINFSILNIIKENNIQEKIEKNQFNYFYDSFKEFIKKKEESKKNLFEEQIKIRAKLNTNIALSTIFSPGKLRIMNKIFNHEALTNTELKYYYRSIRPLILTILNENLQKYVRIIESLKKITL